MIETGLSGERGLITHDRVWITVFIFAFLGLMVDGADLMFLSYSLPSFKQEFGLSNVEAGAFSNVTLAGMVIGGIYGGWTADRFGYVRTVVWTILVFSTGIVALGFTYNFTQFAVLRFVALLGPGAGYVICNTLMVEHVPTEQRTTVLGTLQAGWPVDYVVAILFAGWILPAFGWWWLFFIAIIPAAVAVPMQCFISEPANYLAARAGGDFTKRDSAGGDGAIKCIFGSPAPRRMFMLWSLTAGLLQLGYRGVNNWIPTYLERELYLKFSSMTGYVVGTYLVMILGKIVAGWLADKSGRRVVFTFDALGAAVFLPVIALHHTPGNIVYLMTVFGFLYGIPYGVNATYVTESFEVRIRDSVVGGAYNVGRIDAAVAPAAIGYFAASGSIGFGFLVMGGAYFLCGLVPALFIKEKLYDP